MSTKENEESKKKTTKKKQKTSPKKEEEIIKEDDSNLKTLYELVLSSDIERITLVNILSDKDYLTQFYEEEKKFLNNEYVKPTLTQKEFEQIIGG